MVPTIKYCSRRSPVYGLKCMVASSQPLASDAGLQILRNGGNAVDAAIGIAAALSVTEPVSTGLGGDCFMLYYNKASNKVLTLNGSGRCPQDLTVERARSDAASRSDINAKDLLSLPLDDVHCVTVPGAAAGWCDALSRWGNLGMSQVLEPAIALAEHGFAVGPITSALWKSQAFQLEKSPNGVELLLNGKAPETGERFRNPYLARTLRLLAAEGKAGFYEGTPGEEICKVVQRFASVYLLVE